MSEKGANIDLLFRNGLKDYEVLPPAGVWEGVKSSGKLKSRSLFLYRVAAAITILLTLSFFTYRLSRDISGSSENPVIAFNVNSSLPVEAVTSHYLPDRQVHREIKSLAVPEVASEVNPDPVIKTNDIYGSLQPLLKFPENKSLSLSNNSITHELNSKAADISEKRSINTVYPDLQYPQNEIKPKTENRWSIAAMASPTYYSKFNTGTDGLSKQLMESEEAVTSYTGGVGLSYKISKRFSIQSGLYYSSLGQKLDGINTYGGFSQYDNSKGDYNFEILTSNGTIYASNPDVFVNAESADRVVTAFTNDVFDPKKASLQYINNSLTQNLSYLELPVILRYKLVDKTLGINVIGGMSYNFLVNNSVYTEMNGNKFDIGGTRGLNPLSLSSSLGMGMEYNFSKKLSLNLEPTFRYYLNPFSVSSGSYIHPYSFGIFSGVSYKF
jgi:hypothetical protein